MKLKIGDVVNRKGFDLRMSVQGFLTSRGDDFSKTQTNPSEWIVCQFWSANNDEYKFEVFHIDQLEIEVDDHGDFTDGLI